jgi:hypothetical protein
MGVLVLLFVCAAAAGQPAPPTPQFVGVTCGKGATNPDFANEP